MLQTIVVDNFFENVNEVINLSKKLKFYPASKNENFPGLRTKSLHLQNYDFFNSVIVKILNYYYPKQNLKYNNSHVAFTKLKYGDKGKTRFHQDDATLAAIIYLSNGDMQSGTTIFHTKKDKQIIVGNKINTMLAYDGKKYHGYTSLKFNTERLTLNVFINNIQIIT